jgi:hypothetical protein
MCSLPRLEWSDQATSRHVPSFPRATRSTARSATKHDPLLVPETVREAIFVAGHGQYGIPRDTSFIARGKELEFYPAGLRTAGDAPVELAYERVHETATRGV